MICIFRIKPSYASLNQAATITNGFPNRWPYFLPLNFVFLLFFLMGKLLPLIVAFCSQSVLCILFLLILYIQLGKVYSVLCTIICHG